MFEPSKVSSDSDQGTHDDAHRLAQLAHAIAEDLIRQGCSKLDASIDRTLHGVGEVMDADTCFLVQPKGERGPLHLTHAWNREEIAPPVIPLGEIDHLFPWLADRMRRRETVRLDSAASIEAMDRTGAEELTGQGFRSVLAVPMWREETFWGWLTLATLGHETAWEEASIDALERIVAMLAGALEHQRTNQDLTSRSQMLEQFGNRLWQLHRVQTRSYRDPAALLNDYLQAGCSIFNLSTGIVSRIDGNQYILQALTTDLPGLAEGMVYDTGDTYCAEVVRTGRTIAYHHVADIPALAGHPVYVGLGLESYISTPIAVHNTLYGTLNFSSTESRPAPFTLQDRELIELMAESIGRFVELRDMEQERDRLVRESSQAEEERHELLQRTEELSSLAVLAAGVAHEINNPLQGMLSHLKVLDSTLPDDPGCRRSVEMVEKGIRSIADIVRKLLVLSAEQAQQRERAESYSAVAYVCQLLGPQFARGGIRIENRIEEGGPRLAIEQREFIQILTNLMLNARDAMPEGGEVDLSAETEDDMTVLRVRDSGTGIDPAIQSRVFTPFFTTKGRQGTGLGLSVADSIVRKSGGAIEVESQPGQGTSFILRLPHLVEGA